MTHDLTIQAELIKLARALGTTADQLGFAESLPSEDIKQLRERISNRLFDEHRHEFRRVAATSKLVPAAVQAKVAERAVPPILSASVAGELPPNRIGDLVSKFSTSYLADVCIEIDPRVVARMMEQIPLKVATAVGQELVRREEFITLGRLIDAAPSNVISAVAANISSNEALLQIGLYAESPQHLGEAIEALPTDRIRDVVHLGVSGAPEYQSAGLALMARVTDDVRKTLGNLAAEADDAALTALLDTGISVGAVAEILEVVAVMSGDAQRRVLALPPLADDAKLKTLVDVTAEHDLWAQLLPLCAYMDEELRRRLAGLVNQLEPAQLQAVVAAAHAGSLWAPLFGFAEYLDAEGMVALFDAVGAPGGEVLHGVAVAAEAEGLWPTLLGLLAHLDEDTQLRIAGAWQHASAEDRDLVIARAIELGLDGKLQPMRDALGLAD